MKYIVVLGDGMPDHPIEEWNGMTPLEKAVTPNLDRLSLSGELGLVDVIPQGLPAGSDVGHLSVLGYDPKRYYTGRAPIEAAAMGISLGPADVAFRCNLVTLGQEKTVLQDFSASHIPSEKSHPLIRDLNERLAPEFPGISFHAGVGYRHLMVWKNGVSGMTLTPPHDITDKPIESFLPKGEQALFIWGMIQKSWKALEGNGTEANSIWLWGQGRATTLKPFDRPGGIISAVDIVRGVGVLAGLEVIDVPGATGYFDTAYEAKAQYALESLDRHDFVFVHVEATDEAGHMGDRDKKVMAIGDLDRRLIGPLLDGLGRFGDYRLLVTSDHATPVALKTHTPDPVVYLIYDSRRREKKGGRRFTEKEAAKTGVRIKVGYEMMGRFWES